MKKEIIRSTVHLLTLSLIAKILSFFVRDRLRAHSQRRGDELLQSDDADDGVPHHARPDGAAQRCQQDRRFAPGLHTGIKSVRSAFGDQQPPSDSLFHHRDPVAGGRRLEAAGSDSGAARGRTDHSAGQYLRAAEGVFHGTAGNYPAHSLPDQRGNHTDSLSDRLFHAGADD